MNRRIVFLSEDPPLKIKGSGISVLLYNIVYALRDRYKIDLVTFALDSKAGIQEIIENNSLLDVTICDRDYLNIYRFLRFGILKSTFQFFSFMMAIPKLIKRYNDESNLIITVVGASVKPVCKAWVLMKLAKKAKHGLYIVDDLELINQRQGNKLENFLIRLFLKSTVLNCDVLVNISEGLRDLYLAQYGKDSVVLLPHFVKRNRLACETSHSIREFRFLYTGGLNLLYNESLKFFSEVIEEINQESNEEILYKLVVQTYSSRNDFEELKFKKQFVSYSTTDNRDDLLNVYQNCDCFLIPYSFRQEDIGMVTTSFPQKVAEIIQYGRKILIFGPEYSSVNKFFSSQDIGFICDRKSKDSLKSAIRKVSSTYLDTNSYLRAYDKFLSTEAVENVFNDLLKKIS